ncbi:MAG: septum formation initiator family protein [Lachnospiraceae bacterium]|nr:septum formation initiator family protein [Lachnospiraceae bacterium]
MLRAKRRRMRRTNRASMGLITLAVLILFGVLTYKTVALDKQTSKYQETINGYQKDLKKLEQEKDDIKDLKEYVESDSYIEEMAREKLGLVYKDEVIFQAKDEDK